MEDPAMWLIRWGRKLEPFFKTLDEEHKAEKLAYRKALIEEVHNNPVDRVIRFFNLAEQGFFKIFGVEHPVCIVTEEDC